MNPPALVISDADNTLWDTDACYASAQIALLKSVLAFGEKVVPRDEQLRLVREIDQRLAESHPRGLGYPPELLAGAIAERLGLTLPASETARISENFLNFIRESKPKLRAGVRHGLTKLSREGLGIWIFTESSEARCRGLLRHHQLEHLIRGVTAGAKSPSLYRNLASELDPHGRIRFCIGDQLDRDVEFAGKAHFKTVYFPSGFRPLWIERCRAVPDFTVSSYADAAVAILDEVAVTTHGEDRPRGRKLRKPYRKGRG